MGRRAVAGLRPRRQVRAEGAWKRWRLLGSRRAFLPGQGSATICGADRRRILQGLDKVQQRFVEQDIEAPRVGSLTWSGGAVPRRDRFFRTVSLGNLDIIPTSPFLRHFSPSCSSVSLLEEFLVLSM